MRTMNSYSKTSWYTAAAAIVFFVATVDAGKWKFEDSNWKETVKTEAEAAVKSGLKLLKNKSAWSSDVANLRTNTATPRSARALKGTFWTMMTQRVDTAAACTGSNVDLYLMFRHSQSYQDAEKEMDAYASNKVWTQYDGTKPPPADKAAQVFEEVAVQVRITYCQELKAKAGADSDAILAIVLERPEPKGEALQQKKKELDAYIVKILDKY